MVASVAPVEQFSSAEGSSCRAHSKPQSHSHSQPRHLLDRRRRRQVQLTMQPTHSAAACIMLQAVISACHIASLPHRELIEKLIQFRTSFSLIKGIQELLDELSTFAGHNSSF